MAFLSASDSRAFARAMPPAADGDPAIAALVDTGILAGRDCVLRFFPIYDFQHQRVAALFCTPMFARAGTQAIYGHKAFGGFSPEEWSAVDCAILQHTLAFAERLAGAGIAAVVGASVSFTTLSDPRGRVLYRDALRAAHAREQRMLVIKIEDVPDTVGGKRIGEIVSCIKPLAPRIWVHLPGSHVPLGGHEMLHAQGLVLSMPARLPMHGMETEARWLARTAALQSALACLDHVDTTAEYDTARAAGVRFVAGYALGRRALKAVAPLGDIRDTLYGAAQTAR